MHVELVKLGFSRSSADPCLYFKNVDNDGIIIFALWVDDLVVATLLDEVSEDFKSGLGALFRISDLGDVRMAMGLSIQQSKDKSEIKVSQEHYIVEMLEKYGMLDAKPLKTP